MKKIYSFLAALVVSMAMQAEVVFNEEHNVASWNAKQLTVANYPVLATAQTGDVIIIHVSAVEEGARICLQNTSWEGLGYDVYSVAVGAYRFVLTEAAAEEVHTNGFFVTGEKYTFDKVELYYQDETIWEGTVYDSEHPNWGQSSQLPNSIFDGLQEGDLLGVTVSELHGDGGWYQYNFRANWATNILEHQIFAAGTHVDALTAEQVTSLQNDVIVLVTNYATATAIHTYTDTKSVGPVSQNDTIWRGEKDFGSDWGEWETLAADKFVNATQGQLLRVRFKDLRAGAQLKVGRSDWETMDDTEIVSLSGFYQDFTITATMLAELQANGMIISGLKFTLTEVMLLDPSTLKPLTLSVPVTEDWVFGDKPSISIHVVNPYEETVTANAVVYLATDKAEPLDTLYSSDEIAALATKDFNFITPNNLAPGFYKATCVVNDDLARAFVFAINPTDIVSAPDAQSDFASYWTAAKTQLQGIDMNPQLTEIPAKSTENRQVYLVEFNSVPDGLTGEPVVVRGYYAEPTDNRKHPVIMHYLGYDSGYRPGGQDVKPYCPSGDDQPYYAEFYLSTRGQSINNRPAAERETDGKGDFTNTYGDWFAFNFGDLDGYYYRGAFMDCIQAIRFVASREICDMNNLFAEGQSQGGAFTYAAAALSDYPFRAIAPGIAFLGDFPDYFQITNWPAEVAFHKRDSLGWTDEQMYEFLSYFDTKNLAPYISAATLACIGLQDNVCPPHTNIAPYNNLLSVDKEITYNPENAHQVSDTWYNEIMTFFNERLDGTTLAVDEANDGANDKAFKSFRNGQLIIVRDNKTYNVLGQQL